ncbi:MAG: Hpt domain-containing protein, partial [Thiobacillus sp.]|nr:Hpt domain-containing protein [Thiobacillus sp.]
MSALLDYDIGPLNWVRGDIDAALQAALGRIQAYSVDADLTNALRLARDDAHQVAGALRMVGLEGAATLAGALESVLDDINENRLLADAGVLRALRNAFEGLQRWVKALADGRGSGELALFPLYKGLRELQGAERVFEGELFFPDLRIRVGNKEAGAGLAQEALAAEVKTARALFQRGLLAFLRNVEAEQGLARMREALVAIERVAPSQAAQTFWWACVGFIDSLIAHGVEADFNVKQLLARIDLQMRRLMEGSPQVAERLLRDALFFVAKSETLDGRAAEVRATLGLDRYLPGRGLLDPETLARMRPVLEAMQNGLKAARDSWHATVEGNASQLAQFQDHLAHLQPQASMFPDSGLAGLLDALGAAAGVCGQRAGEAREQANLEVAATLLFMQNAVEREDILHGDFAARADSQRARLQALIDGRELPAAEAELASQREAERDMLVHMAQEVGQNLKQMEEALDAFFRDADAREGLASLPELAQQAQGALTMLEQPDAARLLGAATELARPYMSEGHPDAATQQRLADAFSSLGLYIEAYCAGRADADRILRPVLVDFGVIDAASMDDEAFADTVESGLPARKESVQAAYLQWRDLADDASAKKKFLEALTELGRDAELIDDASLKQQTHALIDASRDADEPPESLDALVAALTGLAVPERQLAPAELEAAPAAEASVTVDTAVAEVRESTPPSEPLAEEVPGEAVVASVEPDTAVADGSLRVELPEGVEPELLEIFLEEANEVLATMGEAAQACHANPGDREALTVIRRGYHTLKGSGRMVSLNDLGEVAWRHEQWMNGWLSEQKPATADLLNLVARSRGVFQAWVNALQAGETADLAVPALLAAGERVMQGLPIDAPTAAVADAPVSTPSVQADVAAEPQETVAEPVRYQAIVEVAAPAVAEIEAPLHDALAEPPAWCAQVEYAVPPAVVSESACAEPEPAFFAVVEYARPERVEPLLETLDDVPMEAYVPDEICIGTVCLSPGLYEIFLAEAQQRVAVLKEEAARQHELGGSPVSEHARRAVHTLGGIAGTAGIVALSDLAHAFEHYWNGFVHTPLPAAHLSLTQDGVARMSEMLAAIEHKRLPDAASDLIAALAELEDAYAASAAEPAGDAGPALADAAGQAETLPEASAETGALPDIGALIPESKPVKPAPVFERREVADEIDATLLPIFLEEAETLVPDTSAQLRAWKAAPADTGPRDALRRSLHTIKGSARMVGAMRLGELTHVMESRVIAVIEGQLAAGGDVFDTLEAQLDRLADAVERLRQGGAAPVADEPAPEAAQSEPLHAPA